MKGSYILIARVKKDSKIDIGKLGKLDFKKGYYCYVGSANGKTVSLENRLKRHIKLSIEKKGKLRWHIDYFLTNHNVLLNGVIAFEKKPRKSECEPRKSECEPRESECGLSHILEKSADYTVKKFGSSDCKCNSHLYRFKSLKKILDVVESI